MKNDIPAFPRTMWTGHKANECHRDISGMTLRQWYAGLAMQAEIRWSELPDIVAEKAFKQADAMMAEGEKS